MNATSNTANDDAAPDAADACRALREWMIADCIPLWAGVGLDRKTGGSVERLNADGSPDLSAPKRVRVQFRQIYSFSLAYRLKWFDGGRDIALGILDFVRAKARVPDGSPAYVHALTPDAAILDPKIDTYDTAFVLLGLGELYRVSKDRSVLNEIAATVDFLDRRMAAPHGGYLEGLPHAGPRRQNPHMHLFEAMLLLYESTGEKQHLDRAGKLFELFRTRFFDTRSAALSEYFSEDLAPLKVDGLAPIEPGHHMEWVWLLRWFSRHSGEAVGSYTAGLLKRGLGARGADGLLVDGIDEEGRITHATKRVWPQLEEAKAWTAEHEAGDTAAAAEAARTVSRFAARYFKHPVRGGWLDQLDAESRPTTPFLPASTLYHAICATAEVDRVFGRR